MHENGDIAADTLELLRELTDAGTQADCGVERAKYLSTAVVSALGCIATGRTTITTVPDET
jgi:hypothetical protein